MRYNVKVEVKNDHNPRPAFFMIFEKWLISRSFIIFYTILNFVFDYTVVIDTNKWYHSTFIHPEGLAITIGSEYD